jgi:hypothetical protein
VYALKVATEVVQPQRSCLLVSVSFTLIMTLLPQVHDHFISGPKQNLTATGAIRIGAYKLLVGPAGFATWFGEFSPNATFNGTAANVQGCAHTPCLFNIVEDPTEHHDLATIKPQLVKSMLATFMEYNTQFHPGPPQGSDHDGYCAAAASNEGFMSPWKTAPLEDDRIGTAAGTGSSDSSGRLVPDAKGYVDGEDPILKMLRTAADARVGWNRVDEFARGGARSMP